MVNISQLAMEERCEKRERRWKVRVSFFVVIVLSVDVLVS
jgi:hypothetical protein